MEKENTQYRLINFIHQLLIYRWKIILITIIGTAIFVGIAFLLPKQYLTIASVKSSSGSKFNVSSLLGSSGLGGGIGSLMDFAIPSGGGDVDYLYSILTSRSVLDSIIKKFDLKEKYGTYFIEDTREVLIGNMFLEVNYPAGLIYMGIYADKPEQTYEMTNALVYYLSTNFSRLSSEIGKNNRINLEKRYLEVMTELDFAADSLTKFQNAYGVLEPTIQTEVTLRTASALKTELILKEIEADTKSKFLGDNSPEIMLLKNEIAELEKKYNQFFTGLEKGNKVKDFFLPFNQTPKLAMEYFKLFGKVEINTELLKVLIPLLEQTKIQELRDTPSLLILDNGIVPEKKSKPKRVIIVLAGFIFSFFVGFIYVFIRINLSNLKLNNPDVYNKIRTVSNLILSDFRLRKRGSDA